MKLFFCQNYCPIRGKVIREKSRGGRFLWNRNCVLGWIWAGSATFEAGFFKFSWDSFLKKSTLEGENKIGFWTKFQSVVYLKNCRMPPFCGL